MAPSKFPLTLLLAILTIFTFLSFAQSTSDIEVATTTRHVASGINPYTTGMPTATVFPGKDEYMYVGCYNETTPLDGTNAGTRALSGSGSKMEGDDNLTPESCFLYCDGAQYAGLEYARECWCAPYLSSMAQRIDESWCDMPCMGGNGSFCGGRLTLTLYNRTKDDTGSAATWRSREVWWWSVGATGLLAALMLGLL